MQSMSLPWIFVCCLPVSPDLTVSPDLPVSPYLPVSPDLPGHQLQLPIPAAVLAWMRTPEGQEATEVGRNRLEGVGGAGGVCKL